MILPTRAYELIIGLPRQQIQQASETPVLDSATTSSQAYSDSTTIPRDAIFISDLDGFEAEISLGKVGKGKKKNPATIKVYNLDKTIIDQIQEESLVILKAGYTDMPNLPIVYAGQVITVSTDTSLQDSITTITCGDAYTLKKNIRYNNSFTRDTTYREILQDIITTFGVGGVPRGRFVESEVLDQAIKSGATYEGYIEDVINQVTKSIDYRYYTAGGKLYVEPKDHERSVEVVLIEEDNVKGQIRPENNAVTTHTKSETKSARGIRVTTFLNGEITLDKYARVTFGDFQGDYKIDSIKMSLNFRGVNWNTELNCSAFKQEDASGQT